MPLDIRDCNRYYANSIILNSKGEPIFIREIVDQTDTSIRIHGHVIREGKWSPTRSSLRKEYLKPFMPELGLINLDKACYWLYRDTSRQWLKGYNTNNIHIKPLLKRSHDLFRLQTPDRMNEKVVSSLLRRHYYKGKKAIELLSRNSRLSCAVSPRFWLGISVTSENIMVGYKTNVVGYVSEEDSTIVLNKDSKFLVESITEDVPDLEAVIGE